MAFIEGITDFIKDKDTGEILFPKTTMRAVTDETGKSVDNVLNELNSTLAKIKSGTVIKNAQAVNVVFDVPFADANYSVNVTFETDIGLNPIVLQVKNKTNTGFTVHSDAFASNIKVNWIAIAI